MSCFLCCHLGCASQLSLASVRSLSLKPFMGCSELSEPSFTCLLLQHDRV